MSNEGEYIIVTGHRPDRLGGLWDPRDWMPAVNYLADALAAELVTHTAPQAVVCGMAEGFDLMMAAATLIAQDRGNYIDLIAAIPFEGHDRRFQTELARKWHRRALSRATEVHVCSETWGDYRTRNLWMVHQPSSRSRSYGRVWACWNGDYGKQGGGTGQTVRMAQTLGLEVDRSFYERVREKMGAERSKRT